MGSYASFNPRIVLSVSLLFTVITGLGWIKLEPEQRPEKLYTPQTSKAFEDEKFVRMHFPLDVRILNIFYVHDQKGGNLIADKDPIRDLFTLYETIDLYNTVGSDGTVLHDVCIQNAHGNCRKMSILGFWGYNRFRS